MNKKIYYIIAMLFFLTFVASEPFEYNWLLSSGGLLGNSKYIEKVFSIPGKNEVILKVSSGGLSSSRDVTFFVVDSEHPYCVDGKNWIVDSEISPIMPSEEDCFRENGYAGRKNCCTPGKECIVKNGVGTCSEYVNIYITSCSEYINKNDCENDKYNIAESEINRIVDIDNFCGNVVGVSSTGELIFSYSCRCEWINNDEGGEGKCMPRWNSITSSGDGKSTCEGTCQITTTKIVGDCSVDEYKIEYIESVWVGDSGDCKKKCKEGSSQVKIPCGGVVSLDFFDTISFFITLVLIATGYIFLIKE